MKSKIIFGFVKLHPGYSTKELYNLFCDRYLGVTDNDTTMMLYDTFYRKLRMLAKNGYLRQNKEDNTVYWNTASKHIMIRSFEYYVSLIFEADPHAQILNYISKKDGGYLESGSGYKWMITKFLDAIKEAELNE